MQCNHEAFAIYVQVLTLLKERFNKQILGQIFDRSKDYQPVYYQFTLSMNQSLSIKMFLGKSYCKTYSHDSDFQWKTQLQYIVRKCLILDITVNNNYFTEKYKSVKMLLSTTG